VRWQLEWGYSLCKGVAPFERDVLPLNYPYACIIFFPLSVYRLKRAILRVQRRLEQERDVCEEQEERDSGTEDDETDCSPTKPDAEETESPGREDDASSGVSCDGDCEEASTDGSKVETDASCTLEEGGGGTAATLPGPLHCADASYEEGTHWKRGPILGRGACGTVFKVADIGTGLEMAMKEVCVVWSSEAKRFSPRLVSPPFRRRLYLPLRWFYRRGRIM
jgi:hypothetical protein